MSNSNSRKFFRVEDKVALNVSLIDTKNTSIGELFEKRRKEAGLANQFVHDRETNRPSLLSIEKRFPDVAKYIEYLENKIQLLANQSGTNQSPLSQNPTHSVNLSASGISFNCSRPLSENTLVEIGVRLFPSRVSIHTISTIIRCVPTNNNNNNNNNNEYEIAARFTHIHEEDEELLFRHIHHVQTDSLKVVVN